jgi:hypothetical protein
VPTHRNVEPISKIAALIANRLAELDAYALAQAAKKAGYAGVDLLRMFATGEARVPLDGAIRIGGALDLDPPQVFRLSLEQFWAPELVDLAVPRVSEPERELLRIVREALQGTELILTTEREAALRQLFAT